MTSDLEDEMIERDIQERKPAFLMCGGNFERELTDEELRPGAVIWLAEWADPFNLKISYGYHPDHV